MRTLALIAALALTAPLAAWAQDAPPPAAVAAVGQPAPDFTLVDENGTSHTLSQYAGQIVVLEWTNPECPFVQRCYDNDTQPETAQALAGQVVWLAVDSTHFNGPDVNIAWKTQYGFDFPTLQDRDGTVGHLYGARTTPHVFIVDAAGTLAYAGAISNNPRGNEENPINYVTQTVAALQAGQPVPVSETEPWGCSVKYPDEE
jgi:peroxiredoxin